MLKFFLCFCAEIQIFFCIFAAEIVGVEADVLYCRGSVWIPILNRNRTETQPKPKGSYLLVVTKLGTTCMPGSGWRQGSRAAVARGESDEITQQHNKSTGYGTSNRIVGEYGGARGRPHGLQTGWEVVCASDADTPAAPAVAQAIAAARAAESQQRPLACAEGDGTGVLRRRQGPVLSFYVGQYSFAGAVSGEGPPLRQRPAAARDGGQRRATGADKLPAWGGGRTGGAAHRPDEGEGRQDDAAALCVEAAGVCVSERH